MGKLASKLAAMAAVLVGLAATGGGSATYAQSAPSERRTLILSTENDSLSAGRTDRYYTAAIRLGLGSKPSDVPAFLSNFANSLFGGGTTRMSFDLTSEMYTPSCTQCLIPAATDHPYAGILLGTFGLSHQTETVRNQFSLGLGVVGPSALGERIQNDWHKLFRSFGFNANRVVGWGAQSRDEMAVQLNASRTWRFNGPSLGPIETQVLPDVAVGLGSVRSYASAGFNVRIGQGLMSDFGAATQRYTIAAGENFAATVTFPWTLFAGATGYAMARDIALDGNAFAQGPRAPYPSGHVAKNVFVGEFRLGATLIAFDTLRLNYIHAVRTHEFKDQAGGMFMYEMLQLSGSF